MPLEMLFIRKWATKTEFLSKVKLNESIRFLYWPASTKFVTNVAREPKRVAHLWSRQIAPFQI